MNLKLLNFILIVLISVSSANAQSENLSKKGADLKLCPDDKHPHIIDMGAAGKVRYVIPDGLALSDEMRNLYKALQTNGVDVYVFSASLEAAVEAMACDPQYLGLDTSRVFALRMKKDDSDLVLQEYRPGYVRPYKDGKSKAIRAYVSPLYDGRDPVLIGGDSIGDYWMLTEFHGMRVGLIIDKNQTGPLGELRQQALDAEAGGAPSRYVLQRRGDPEPRFSRK